MSGAACSIIALNYLPYVRALVNSYLKYNDGPFYVLILDLDCYDVDLSQERFSVLGLNDLQIPKDEIEKMLSIYDVMELATALKPFLLKLLLVTEGEPVTYLDPDICVYDNIDEVKALDKQYGLTLTPHVLSQVPNDGCFPSESIILVSGIFNLGFISVNENANLFLELWGQFTKRHCISEIKEALFVDQRFCDLAPLIVDSKIIQSPRFNVAYWNLYERTLIRQNNDVYVNGEQLGFFHFSGFNPTKLDTLSKHELGKSRFNLKENDALLYLLLTYSNEVLANEYEKFKNFNYGYSTLPSGLTLDKIQRRVYRKILLRSEAFGDISLPNPFEDKKEFIAMLNMPVCEISHFYDSKFIKRYPGLTTSKLTWYLFEYWRDRSDLVNAFPDVLNSDLDRYYKWIHRSGLNEGLDPELVPDLKWLQQISLKEHTYKATPKSARERAEHYRDKLCKALNR